MAKKILMASVILFVLVAGYSFIKLRDTKAVPNEPVDLPGNETLDIIPDETTEVNWEELIPQIRTALGSEIEGMKVEEMRPIQIQEIADVTSDGIPEALVDLGTGGAYTTTSTLIKIKNNLPVVVSFLQSDGITSPLIFLRGASVANGSEVAMVPDKNEVHSISWSINVPGGKTFGSLAHCDTDVYVWNSGSNIFEYNQIRSLSVRSGYCSEIESSN